MFEQLAEGGAEQIKNKQVADKRLQRKRDQIDKLMEKAAKASKANSKASNATSKVASVHYVVAFWWIA